MVSVRPSQKQKPATTQTFYVLRRTPCVKIMIIWAGAWRVILNSSDLFQIYITYEYHVLIYRLSIRSSSNPISIPGATSLRTPDIRINAENDDDEDDEVFVSNDKENVHKRKRFDTSKLKPALQVDHLFPSYSDEKGICVNSPGRRELQKVKNLSSLNIKVIGRGSFGSVVLGSWRGKTFLIHQADLQLQPMVITIFSQRLSVFLSVPTFKSCSNHCPVGCAAGLVDH